jgi:predicted component of type VI protein secretion system
MSGLQLTCLAANVVGGGIPAVLTITRFPSVLGRHPGCEYRLNDPLISRRHCAFSPRHGRAWVEDLASLNGTWLNGEPVTSARPLADGDLLELVLIPLRVNLLPGVPVARSPALVAADAAPDSQPVGLPTR